MKMRKVAAALIFLVLLNLCSAIGDTDGTCSVDDDCSYLYTCQQNTCVHKDLFPITFREVGGTVLILLFNSIITVNCVGAADAYVPYLSLIFKHTFRKSFFLEFACLLGGELGNILNIARFRDPRNKRYMINFEVNMVIVPALMIGGHIGALISGLLAPFVANLIFIAALCLCIYRNIRGLRANLKKEKEAKIVRAFKIPEESQKMNDLTSSKDTLRPSPFASFRAENDSNSADVSKIFPIQPNSPVMPSSPVFSSSPGAQAVEDASLMPPSEDNRQPETGEALELSEIAKKRNKIIEKEQSFPFYKLREIMINAVIIVVISLIRGSKTFTPIVGVEWSCKWEFLWFGIGILVFGLNMSRSIYLIRKWQKEKVAVGYEFPPGDPLLTKKNFIHLILRSILSGCIGPTIFLGGAAVTGPLVTDMGIPSDYFESTADVITIFAAFNAMFKGTVYGVITWQEVMWFLPLGFVCSFFSSKLATWYVRKTGKQSTNILTLVVISMIGLVGLLAIFIKSLVDNFDQQIVFNNVC